MIKNKVSAILSAFITDSMQYSNYIHSFFVEKYCSNVHRKVLIRQ